MSDRMGALARRVEGDPFFLASALAIYAHAERLSDADLAARLGCSPERLSAIRLCRMPRSEPARFQHDVDRVAEAFQIDGGVIAEAVRLSEALSALGELNESDGYLMAARDRIAEDAADYKESDGEP